MLILEIDIRQLLSGVVDHDEAGVIEFFKDRGGDYSRALQPCWRMTRNAR